MLVGLIIALGIAVGAILFGLQTAQTLPEAVLDALTDSFKWMVGQSLLFLAGILPLLALAIPLYLLRHRSDEIVVFGALYGLGLAALTILFGLQDYVVSLFQTSWYSGWTSSIIPELAGAIYALFYYIIGAFLWVLDMFLAGLVGLAELTEWLRRNVVAKARRAWSKRRPR